MARAIGFFMLVLFTGLAAGQSLAPDPAKTREAVVQVWGARTLGFKGLFGVHTWIAVKPTESWIEKSWAAHG